VGVVGVAILAISAPASAQTTTPNCTGNANIPNPVIISGSSASKPVLQALANVLGSAVSIIYQNPDSCLGVADWLGGMPSTETGIATQFLNPATGSGSACTPQTTDVVDIAVSDVFPATCAVTLTANQVEVEGPIQAMTFAAPSGSQGSASISAEAAYVVFGYDATTNIVAQWATPTSIYTRASTSGTLNMIGAAIGLKPGQWANAAVAMPAPAQQASGTSGMFTDIANATGTPANQTIGILSDEAVIQNNATALAKAADAGTTAATVKALYYQHTGQSCGYLPDSNATTFDKANVREGRYAIWGPLHFMANLDATSKQPNGPHAAAVAAVLNYFLATGANPSATLFTNASDAGTIDVTAKQAVIDNEANPLVGGVVPWCAMHVMRTSEIGPEMSFSPAEPCGCHFEKVATGATISSYCKACSSNSDCAADGSTSAYPVCRYGYCEVQ
jgi:hypothetical protein